MSKDKSSEQTDADILQCKADILRARDVTSSHDEKVREPTDSAANPPQVCEDAAPIPVEIVEHKAAEPPTVTAVNQKPAVGNQHEIPKFDLAEEIMAEQRRITAIKRKAPGQKTEAQRSEPQAQPVGYPAEQPLSEQGKIITEIVARDIKKLCHDNMQDVNRREPRP